MNKSIFSAVGIFSLALSLYGDAYYKKGELTALTDKVEKGGYLTYNDARHQKVAISDTLIVKTLHQYDQGYFESKYGLVLTKSYGNVMIFKVQDINSVVPLCKEIYENESVVYAQPSFVKKINTDAIKFEDLSRSKHPLQARIVTYANENTKSMLDAENSVNYWKYYDDVFRYEDESFWHLYNKGGFVTQAYYQGEFYDVVSQEDVDTNALDVIDKGITGKNVKIVVVDSSFELEHPDLRFSDSYNFYRNNKEVTPDSTADFHGTAVAGVIGANRGNNYGVMGVAPDAYLIAFNGLFEIEEDTLFTQSYIDIFYTALVLNADIINCSWSTVGSVDEASEDAINTFVEEARGGKGGFVVFSSGNEGSTSLLSEAALESVISVGSIEADGTRSRYSNYGPKLDLVAPSNFVSLDLTGANGFESNEMGFVAGTSFSAPVVSAILALMLEVNPDITREEALNVLYSTTKKVGNAYDYAYNIEQNSKYNTLYPKAREVGYGLVDAAAAVAKADFFRSVKDKNTSIEEHGFLDNIQPGWNFVGTEKEIVNLNVFDEVEIAWCYIDGEWKGYASNPAYAKELRKQNQLFTSVPRNSGMWVYKNE